MYSKEPEWLQIKAWSGVVWSNEIFAIDDEVISMLETVPEYGQEYYVLLRTSNRHNISGTMQLLYTPPDVYVNSVIDCPQALEQFAIVTCHTAQILSQDDEEAIVKVTVAKVILFPQFEQEFSVTSTPLIHPQDGTLLSEIKEGSFAGYGNSIISGHYGILELCKDDDHTEVIIMKQKQEHWYVLMYMHHTLGTNETYIGNNLLDTETNTFIMRVLHNCKIEE